MALGEFKLFQFKSRAQIEKEDKQYALWAFPYGDLQRTRLTSLLEELNPKASKQIGIASYLTCKELYEKTLEDTKTPEAATEKMLKVIRNYQQLIRTKEMPLYLALVLADSEIDEECRYPSADEIKKQIQEFEIIRQTKKTRK